MELKWNQVGSRRYESGIDRGVLYSDNGVVVPWNGLTRVTASSSGGETRTRYIDGQVYHVSPSNEDYSGSLEAFTYPNEFKIHDGWSENYNGLSFGYQKRRPFGLSYRSLVGDDVVGTALGYKIHLVYNVLATPSERTYETISGDSSLNPFTWSLSATPLRVSGHKPTAYVVIESESTPPELLSTLERILYGTVDAPPRLPSLVELYQLFDTFRARDGLTLTILSPSLFSLAGDGVQVLSSGRFSIDSESISLLNDTITITT